MRPKIPSKCDTCVHNNKKDTLGCPKMGCMANGYRDYKQAEGKK
jgi:hypothetical protein